MFGNEFEFAMRGFSELCGKIVQDPHDDRITIAYIVFGNTVEFATAICAPNDVPCEAIGMAIALQHFEENKTVMLPTDSAFFL